MGRVYTIGHSNRPVEHLVGRLERHGVRVLADVRSRPYSRHNPQFNRERLADALREVGIAYVYCGHSLGGVPEDPELLTADGRPDYDRMRASPCYRTEMEGLLRAVREGLGPVVLMCAEQDPSGCHRRRLVGADLVGRGHDVVHIMGDGQLRTEHEVREGTGENQPSVLDVFG